MKKVAVITATRAEYGLLMPVIKELRKHENNNFKVELNLIGMTVEEAMPVLDKFLDSALLAKAPFVRVVHGFGTGALRKAVWDRLKKCSYVAKYEAAPSAQGGSGATIVTFKE